MSLVTILTDHVLTLSLETDVIKSCRLFVLFLIGENSVTEATLFAIQVARIFLAVLPSVIWYHATPMAENELTATTSDAIPAHMDRCSW